MRSSRSCETCCSMTGYADQWPDYKGLPWNNGTCHDATGAPITCWEEQQCYDNFAEVFDGSMNMRTEFAPNPTNAKPKPHMPTSMATVGFTILHPSAALAARRARCPPRSRFPSLPHTYSLLHTTHRSPLAPLLSPTPPTPPTPPQQCRKSCSALYSVCSVGGGVSVKVDGGLDCEKRGGTLVPQGTTEPAQTTLFDWDTTSCIWIQNNNKTDPVTGERKAPDKMEFFKNVRDPLKRSL